MVRQGGMPARSWTDVLGAGAERGWMGVDGCVCVYAWKDGLEGVGGARRKMEDGRVEWTEVCRMDVL